MVLSNKVQTWKDFAVEFFFLLAVITIPFDNNVNSYCIVAFCLVGLLSNSLSDKWDRLNRNKVWMLPVAYFIWIALRFLWDPGSHKSTSVLEQSASLLAFPLVLGSVRPFAMTAVKRILFLFVSATIAGAIFCLWKSYLDYQATDYINVFFYHHLSLHIGLNAIYFSMYTVFSIMILLYHIFFEKWSRGTKVSMMVVTFFLVLFSVLLASKMFLFLLILIFLSLCIFLLLRTRKLKPGLIILVVLLIAIPVLLFQFPYVKSRIAETELMTYTGAKDKYNGLAVRSLLWKSTWKLIQEAPVLGMGQFATQDALRLQYQKAGFEEGVKEDFNSHNQYLYTWANYGIVGLCLILFYMCLVVRLAYRQKNILMLIFGLVFMVANLTECMLEVQKGIVFYMLFSSLFLYQNYSKAKEVVI